MGKQGDLWDDSALINAFDQAISKYKKMHGKGYKEDLNTVVADLKSSSSDVSAAFDPIQEDNRKAGRLRHSINPEMLDGGNANSSHAILEVQETESCKTTKGNEVPDSEVSAEHALGSNSFPLQNQTQIHSNSLDTDEYNQLYKQYYEVEEQRQMILQKLQNFSNWQYSYPSEAPVSGSQWGANASTQGYQSCISQVPCGSMVVSCCPCTSQCSMASCSSLPCPFTGVSACNLGGNPLVTKDLGKQPAVEDDIVKTAMGAAERAISTLNNKISGSNEDNKFNNVVEQSATSGTDLSTVLNAWYSAGFYTGKYLTEKSLAKKQDG